MPRGRPSAVRRLSATPNDSQSGRSTRFNSVSSRADTATVVAADTGSNPPRRLTRHSLLANETTPASSPKPVASATRRARRSGGSVLGSESVSSAPTPADTFSDRDDISTPATSKVPTPAAGETFLYLKNDEAPTPIEIQLSSASQAASKERRSSSRFSLTSKDKGKAVIVNSDDNDDEGCSDNSNSTRTARRLQEEEYTKAYTLSVELPTRRRSSRGVGSAPSPTPSRSSTKRGRSGTHTNAAPPNKKNKTIPNSDESLSSQIDIDAELAAAAAMDIDDGGGEDKDNAFEPDSGSDLTEIDDYEDEAVSSEDEPLSSKAKGKQRARRSRSGKVTGNPSTAAASSNSVIEDSDEALSLPDASEELSSVSSGLDSTTPSEGETERALDDLRRISNGRRAYRRPDNRNRVKKERNRLEMHHPELKTMWTDLENMPILKAGRAEQPHNISRRLKPFQLEGLAWMKEMEKHEWKGGLLGDEMGLGKTIQAVSLIMSDYPAKQPSLVLVPPVALMQWQSEIKSYTDGTLKTLVFHGTNSKTKNITKKELRHFDVIMMSYNSLESIYRKQEKGFKRKDGIYKEESVIHAINFHRVILDEAHSIKTRTTMTAKACFALKTDYRWCLTGTPLQNRIGEFFSLIRFLNISPFASYLCKQCPCTSLEWSMNEDMRCSHCGHGSMQHVSVFNQELLNPIQKYGNFGPGREAFRKLRLMTERIMLRRLKKDHTNSMELPVKEIYVDRQFFGEEENDFANSIMTNGQRKFDTYVAQGVLLNNYANIFGLIMQMRQVADHPDLILKKNAEGGQNVLVCCICDEPAEDTVRSRCKHDFCRTCVASYVRSTEEPDCPRCHIPLVIDLEQPEIEQDEALVKKSSIINRIKMENWTSSSKIELLVHELHKLRSDNTSQKSIIFSQFTTMLQLIEWRLRRAGITTVMLDGSMTPTQRQASIEHFMNNVDVECFLVSLKAGGVALNLTEASRVFIVDPWWNPAAEWQSADRCHRIGQTRPCTITRLCIEDSVESRMVLIQEKKTNMINSTVNADDKAMESLSPEDMQFLFRGS